MPNIPINPVIADLPAAADICEATAVLLVGRATEPPSPVDTWIDKIPQEVRGHLAVWMRTEAVAFRTDETRGSVYGFPSWYFARAVCSGAVAAEQGR
jgi:hypothetical protein